jgi:hypothetical protein
MLGLLYLIILLACWALAWWINWGAGLLFGVFVVTFVWKAWHAAQRLIRDGAMGEGPGARLARGAWPRERKGKGYL